MGRFLNADDAVVVHLTLGNVLNTNTYAYVNNSVVAQSDVSGYITPVNVIGAIVGAGLGALIGVALVNYFRLTRWKKWLVIAGSSAIVAIAGWFAGS